MICTVRAVVVDYDGAAMTARCVRSLLDSGWSGGLEVVVVDNGSAVPVADRLPADERVRVVRSERNLGFAGGADLGIGDPGEVDAVALVNNDVVVRAGWLEGLAAALDADAGAGAASPLMLFPGRHRPLVVEGHGLRVHAVRAPGAVRPAPTVAAPTGEGDAAHRPVEGTATFWVEDGPGPVTVTLSASRPAPARVSLGGEATAVEVGPEPRELEVAAAGEPVVLVNNAGTALAADGYGFDLGYLEPASAHDGAGPARAVPLWSGGAVLLRSAYLRQAGLFDERLFLYYEDVDLGLRGAAAGWAHLLVPASVVDHDHSATAVAGSSFAERYKERNRLLVVLRHRGWAAAAVAVARFVVATLGYVRRDVVAAVLQRRRPTGRIVADRLAALGGAIRLAPAFRPGSRPLR